MSSWAEPNLTGSGTLGLGCPQGLSHLPAYSPSYSDTTVSSLLLHDLPHSLLAWLWFDFDFCLWSYLIEHEVASSTLCLVHLFYFCYSGIHLVYIFWHCNWNMLEPIMPSWAEPNMTGLGVLGVVAQGLSHLFSLMALLSFLLLCFYCHWP
jgi:hypothetical protein